MQHYQPREQRRPTRLEARINDSGNWSDAVILNVSSRGFMAECNRPPARGTFIELRRGSNTLVAQVRWNNGRRFGALTQSPIDYDALSDDTHRKNYEKRTPAKERRNKFRPADGQPPTPAQIAARAEASQRWSRAFEFAGLGLAVMIGALVLADTVSDMLRAPLVEAEQGMQTRNQSS